MKVLYCSSMCSEKTFTELKMNLAGQQVQKYHRILNNGLKKQKTISIIAFSKIGNAGISKNVRFYKNEIWNDIPIHYLNGVNISVIGHFFQAISSFFCVLKLSAYDTIVCLDVLNATMGIGVVLACKLKKLKLVGIVTDLPSSLLSKGLYPKIGRKILSECDSYLLLTEQMNDVFNVNRKKPYVVIEGQVDSSMVDVENELKKKEKPRVFLYAGMLTKANGVDLLINAFIKANLENTELHLFGGGEEEDFVNQICKEHTNIKYFGCLLNDEIVKREITATLLINPRPSNQEFVKYSFPSKLMEYMASGTPVLTTRLCGIPQDYYPHIYTIAKEDEDGICEKLKELAALSDAELHEKGIAAKNFVMENKNEKVQGKKFADLLKTVAAL